MLVILIPHTVITVIIHKIIDNASAVLLVLNHWPSYFSPWEKCKCHTLPLSFNVLAFIDIAVFKYRLSLSVGFASFHFHRYIRNHPRTYISLIFVSDEKVPFIFIRRSRLFSWAATLPCDKYNRKIAVYRYFILDLQVT